MGPDDSEEEQVWSPVSMMNLHETEPPEGYEFTLKGVPGEGSIEVTVSATPDQAEGVYLVTDPDGETFAVYPNGEVAPV